MPWGEVAAQLREDQAVLRTTLRNVPERHRSIEAAFEYSWQLLSHEERRVLRALSVFRGGFSREAAKEVAGAGLSVLVSLVDKSLLKLREGGRFGRHPLLYEFTKRKLTEHPEEEAEAQRRHTAHYLAFAEAAAPHLSGEEQAAWLGRVEREIGNVQVALAWATRRGDGQLRLRLLSALEKFWYVRDAPLGRTLLEDALASTRLERTCALRGSALRVLGLLRWRDNDLSGAQEAYEEGLSIQRSLGDDQEVARLLNNLGILASIRKDFGAALRLYERSLVLKRRLGDTRGVAASLNNMGIAARHQGDFAAAYHLYKESLDLEQELGNAHGVAASLNNMGKAASALGQPDQAKRHLLEALRLERELGDTTYLLHTVAELINLEFSAGHLVQAATLLGAEETLRENLGSPFLEDERNEFEGNKVELRAELGAAKFSAAWAEGRAMDRERVIAYALGRLGLSNVTANG